ncbi:MAG: hypothetical protein K8E66_09670, partial [Phycisphaerales bacterium]|nr:hypothetical protein [Phycisphaerales bacterium]
MHDEPNNTPRIEIGLPGWVRSVAAPGERLASRVERMALAIELSRQNVGRGDGGPFGAAVFEIESGRLVSSGVNLVVKHGNSALHAEVVALMFAQRRLDSFTLADGPA